MDRADRELDSQLDDNSFDESQLISFKVPITGLSYYSPSYNWERVEGSIEVGNAFYKYVKRRVAGDSLEVLCIPHSTATKLQAMKHQGSRNTSYKMPSPEPYVCTALCSMAPSFYILVPSTYFYPVLIPDAPGITEDRPPAVTA